VHAFVSWARVLRRKVPYLTAGNGALEKILVIQLLKKFSAFHKNTPLVITFKQVIPSFLNIHSDIILEFLSIPEGVSFFQVSTSSFTSSTLH
jgi:hypothetical protein